eukprot:TRINITY_DN33068_c0_g1_i1.p1 TRINITY_DN33068_c0_g1~~TRINITY_DN33068_c0_g1_i1.p1  ORF type:complete len:375 (+),score=78.90 TRINITY_DN33068_c0_g1_i1:37-1161(+)
MLPDLVSSALSLIILENYAAASRLLTEALVVSHGLRGFILSHRSNSRRLSGDIEGSLADANESLAIKPTAFAYYMNGLSLFSMGSFQEALSVFENVEVAEPSEDHSSGLYKNYNMIEDEAIILSAKRWIMKCRVELELDEQVTRSANESVINEKTQKVVEEAAERIKQQEPEAPRSSGGAIKQRVDKYSRDFYQTSSHVTIAIYIKGIESDGSTIEFDNNEMSVDLQLPNGSRYMMEVDLAGPIIPFESKYTISASKIEIVLKKADSRKWKALERSEADQIAEQKPSYPSSSKNKKDWAKVNKESEEATKGDDEGDELNALLKGIYSNATEETRRAMNKSFSESGGTVLSTSWKDVGYKNIDPTPPEGMEAVKY